MKSVVQRLSGYLYGVLIDHCIYIYIYNSTGFTLTDCHSPMAINKFNWRKENRTLSPIWRNLKFHMVYDEDLFPVNGVGYKTGPIPSQPTDRAYSV